MKDLYVWPENAPMLSEGHEMSFPLWDKEQSHFHLSFVMDDLIFYLEKIQITVRICNFDTESDRKADTTGFHRYMGKEDFNNAQAISTKLNECINWWHGPEGRERNPNVDRVFQAMSQSGALRNYLDLWKSDAFQGVVYDMICHLTEVADQWDVVTQQMNAIGLQDGACSV